MKRSSSRKSTRTTGPQEGAALGAVGERNARQGSRRNIARRLDVGLAIALVAAFSTTVTADEVQMFPVWNLDFSRNGSLMATVSGKTNESGNVVIWNVADWTTRLVHNEEQSCSDVAFSPDSRRVLFGMADSLAAVLDVSNGEILRRFQGDRTLVRAVDWSADGKTLLTAGADREIKLWDAGTFDLKQTLAGHEDVIYDADFSPDGRYVVSGSSDKTARLWDASTGQQIAVFKPSDLIVRAVGFSGDGRFFNTSRYDNTARVYETESRRLRARLFVGSQHSHLSPDVRFIAGCDTRYGVTVAPLSLQPPDAQQERQISELMSEWESDDYSVREAASARIAEIGMVAEPLLHEARNSSSAEVRIRAREARRQVLAPEPVVTFDHPSRTYVVRFSPDGHWLVSTHSEGSILVHDTESWELVRALNHPNASAGDRDH
ncbi:MAG: WD40 repeat domain-containing protein [Fuerstiella sp.]